MPVEAATDSPESRCPVRRSGRQPKRTDKLEEFLLTAKRGSRKSAPPSVESGDPPSQTPTDAETASEASFDGSADSKAVEDKPESPERRTRSSTKKQTQKKTHGGRQTRSSGRVTDMDEDNPSMTETRKPVRTYVNKKRAAKTPVKTETKPKVIGKASKPEMQDKNDDDEEADDSFTSSSSSSSDESDDAGYDPNALYCICRQKHNKRFMICCDRCEEWFHGDCVGITEARGRLMERNGEDYICPNCTAKKNQVVRPATSGLTPNTEVVKPKSDDAAAGTEDLGIKGRIEKAINPTGKKKIKIFQPQMAEDASLPKCIGPGCESNAQPDSVYCGNDCILKHAAAAMKSITDVKDPKDKTKAQTKVTWTRSHLKSGKRSASDCEKHLGLDVEKDEEEHAEEQRPPPSTASWSSDHNYIAATPEKTTPMSPTVLNKKCMYLFEVSSLPGFVGCSQRSFSPTGRCPNSPQSK
uniref:Death inducer-obliterator 1 n=1 Tax=Nothobranchius furzeri TaxID=105023 RepID=A0A8C6LFH4_NOTFU